jgi:hypothetical protein
LRSIPSENGSDAFEPEEISLLLREFVLRAIQHGAVSEGDLSDIHAIGGDALFTFVRTVTRLQTDGDSSTLLRLGDEFAACNATAHALIAYIAASRLGASAARMRCLELGERLEGVFFGDAAPATFVGRVECMMEAVECYLEAEAFDRVEALRRRFQVYRAAGRSTPPG